MSSHNVLRLKRIYHNFRGHQSATRFSWHQHHGVPSCRGMVSSFKGAVFSGMCVDERSM